MDVKIWEKEYCDRLDSPSFTAIIDDRGRITIPASVRKKLKIKYRSTVSVIVKSLKIKTDK